MKITKIQLKQIIKEELAEVLDETEEAPEMSPREAAFARAVELLRQQYGDGLLDLRKNPDVEPTPEEIEDRIKANKEFVDPASRYPHDYARAVGRTEKEKRYGIYPGRSGGPGSLGS